jgi:cytochrome c
MKRQLLLTAVTLAAVPVAIAAGPPPDAKRGKQVFQQCAACHSVTGAASLGPDLRGVTGGKAAARTDYRYSPALMRSGIVWSGAVLDAFLANPQAVVRGNKMPYAGMKDARDRADLLAYLKGLK